MVAIVSREQFLSAVGAMANAELFYQAIPADKGDINWIQYNSAFCVKSSDSLALLLQSTFGWTTAQLDSFFANAAQFPGGNNVCSNE